MDEMINLEIRMVICRLMLRRYRGTSPLIDCLKQIIADEDNQYHMGAKLFPQIAAQHRTTTERMYRNFRTIIAACWREENREYLNSLMGRELERKPTVSEFVADLANHFMRL